MASPNDQPTSDQIAEDLLERLDKLTSYIIEIKADMYRRAEFQFDSARIYDHVSTIQAQILLMIKEAVIDVNKRIDTVSTLVVPRAEHQQIWVENNHKFSAFDRALTEVKKRLLPWWLIAAVSSLLTIVASQVVQNYMAGKFTHP